MDISSNSFINTSSAGASMQIKKTFRVPFAVKNPVVGRKLSIELWRPKPINLKQPASLYKMFEDQQQKNSTDTNCSSCSHFRPLNKGLTLGKPKRSVVDIFAQKVQQSPKKIIKKYSCVDPGTSSKSKQQEYPHLFINRANSSNQRRNRSRNSKILMFCGRTVRIIRKLGQGKCGNVFLVVDNAIGIVMAMKSIQKNKITSNKILQQLISQLKIQTYLNHPNIVKTYGFSEDKQNVYILMELGSEGQLYQYMQKACMNQQSTSFIIRSLLSAVHCLHQNSIIHRDIKPENIVVTHGTVKLCDFGWAVHLRRELRSTYCGTPLYFSPQIIVGQKYDEKVDIWAIGILTYEMVLGSSPFAITRQNHLYKIVTDQVKFPEDSNKKISLLFKNFVTCILRRNPKDRFTCEQLLQMPFIKKYQAFETCEQLCK